MHAYFADWLSLGLRWLHVVAAIAWIGESFYFVMLDNSLKPPVDPAARAKGVFGELWAVHGGGFYNPQKYLVAPAELPAELHWSKWPSYTTWLSGFTLFATLYLLQPSTYLIDKNVADLTPTRAVLAALAFLATGWLFYDRMCRLLGKNESVLGGAVGVFVVTAAYAATHLFAGRAAFLIVGAMLATIMTANVFFLIIPGQKKMVAAMLRGDTPDPIHGKLGKQRSVHNTYFTLPVVFSMISNHYAVTYSHPHSWVVLSCIMFAGALIRQFFVLKHRGRVVWGLPAAGVALLAVVVIWARPAEVALAAGSASLTDVQTIVAQRCLACHSAHPTLIGSAPAGVMLDSAEAIVTHAARIYRQTVVMKTMPLANITHMTEEERGQIAQWFTAGAAR